MAFLGEVTSQITQFLQGPTLHLYSRFLGYVGLCRSLETMAFCIRLKPPSLEAVMLSPVRWAGSRGRGCKSNGKQLRGSAATISVAAPYLKCRVTYGSGDWAQDQPSLVRGVHARLPGAWRILPASASAVCARAGRFVMLPRKRLRCIFAGADAICEILRSRR